MADTYESLRLALGGAYMGDTAVAKGMYVAPQTFDARLHDLLVGLGIGADSMTGDHAAIGANLKTVLDTLGATQADRITFLTFLANLNSSLRKEIYRKYPRIPISFNIAHTGVGSWSSPGHSSVAFGSFNLVYLHQFAPDADNDLSIEPPATNDAGYGYLGLIQSSALMDVPDSFSPPFVDTVHHQYPNIAIDHRVSKLLFNLDSGLAATQLNPHVFGVRIWPSVQPYVKSDFDLTVQIDVSFHDSRAPGNDVTQNFDIHVFPQSVDTPGSPDASKGRFFRLSFVLTPGLTVKTQGLLRIVSIGGVTTVGYSPVSYSGL